MQKCRTLKFYYIVACLDGMTSDIRYSPATQTPPDHSNSREDTQKKVIDCPISSHDPVSCTI